MTERKKEKFELLTEPIGVSATLEMESSSKLPIDSEESDDDDLKQEITETVEKFVQTRHVQTLKYLQHVIDENRHLRLHIEHLKRRQNDPVRSPGAVDPIDPEDPPIDEIPVEVPEVEHKTKFSS